MTGRITLSFDTAPSLAYGTWSGPLAPAVVGPERLLDLFTMAERRIKRREAQRARAAAPSRPRYRMPEPPLTADAPAPKGWHLRGACPDCP